MQEVCAFWARQRSRALARLSGQPGNTKVGHCA